VSPQTVKLLRQLGYDIKGVAEAGFKGCEDDEVVNLARFTVTVSHNSPVFLD